MTIEELQVLAEGMLEFGIAKLREKGQLLPMFHLVGPGVMEVMIITPEVNNDPVAMAEVGVGIKERISAGGVDALVMVGDTFVSRDLTRIKAMVMQSLGMSIEDAAKAGMCTATSAVRVKLESPIFHRDLMQRYKVVDNDRIELLGPVEIDDTGRAVHIGGFGNFFPLAKGTGTTQ